MAFVPAAAFTLTLLVTAYHGVATSSWLNYSWGADLQPAQLPDADPHYRYWSQTTTAVRNGVERSNLLVYLSPLQFLMSAVALRSLMLAVYLAWAWRFTGSKWKALAACALIAFSLGTGNGSESLRGPSLYYGGNFATPLILGAWWAIEERRFAFAGSLLGLAVPLEAPSAVAALPFLLVRSFILARAEPDKWRSLVVLTLVFLAFVVPMLPGRVSVEEATALSWLDWYRFLLARAPWDVTLSFAVRDYGLTILALSACCIALCPARAQDTTEASQLGMLALLVPVMAVELLLAYGVAAGPLSEMFVATQVRRAWFLLSLLLMPMLIEATLKLTGAVFTARTTIGSMLLVAAYYLVGSTDSQIAIAVLISSLGLIAARAPWRALGLATATGLILVLAMLVPVAALSTWGFVSSDRRLLLLLVLAAGALGVAARRNAMPQRLRFLLFTAVCASGFVAGVTRDFGFSWRVARDMSHMPLCFTCTIDRTELLRAVDDPYPGRLFGRYASENEREEYIEALRFVGNRGVPGRVLTDPVLRLPVSVYAGLPGYLHEEFDRGMSEFSRAFAASYDSRLKDVFGR